jgi:hypothetical protein
LPKEHAYTLEPGHPTPGLHNLLRPPIASHVGIGLLTDFPSATRFRLTLGADSPCADERCAGNLGLSASGPFTRFIATHVSIRTSDTSSTPLGTPSQAYGTLSYHVCNPLSILTKVWRAPGKARRRAKPPIEASGSLDSPGAVNTFRWIAHIHSFGARFEPRYIFRAGRLDQ